jgi:hypothetical protein
MGDARTFYRNRLPWDLLLKLKIGMNLRGSSAAYKMKDERNHREDQKQMDHCGRDVEHKKAAQPEDDQNCKKRDEQW